MLCSFHSPFQNKDCSSSLAAGSAYLVLVNSFNKHRGPLANSPFARGRYRSVGWRTVALKSRDHGRMPSIATERALVADMALHQRENELRELNSGKTN